MKINKASKINRLFLFAVVVFILSYLLNFLWESIHAKLFYTGFLLENVNYWNLMIYASTIDSLLVILMYFTTALFFKDIYWIKKTSKYKILLFITIGFLIAIYIEYLNVYILHRWEYNELMPTIFGIGLSPLIQLSITGLVSILLSKRIIFR